LLAVLQLRDQRVGDDARRTLGKDSGLRHADRRDVPPAYTPGYLVSSVSERTGT
jgi:hypothetical protein